MGKIVDAFDEADKKAREKETKPKTSGVLVRLIQDIDMGNKGEIINYTKSSAKDIVNEGFGEYVVEKEQIISLDRVDNKDIKMQCCKCKKHTAILYKVEYKYSKDFKDMCLFFHYGCNDCGAPIYLHKPCKGIKDSDKIVIDKNQRFTLDEQDRPTMDFKFIIKEKYPLGKGQEIIEKTLEKERIDREKEFSNTKIQFYNSCKDTKGHEILLKDVYEMVKSEKYKDITDVLRNELKGENNKDKRMKYKQDNLPAVTFGGIFSHRDKEHLTEASGIACGDIDEYDVNVKELKEKLSKEPTVCLIFESPSGSIKFAWKIPKVKNAEEYDFAFVQGMNHFKKYSPKQDKGTKDVCRLCFLSYDPDIYINENAEEFKVDWDKKDEVVEIIPPPEDKDTKIPEYCPYIVEVLCKKKVPSGKITRHSNIDGNIHQYAKHHNKPEIKKIYSTLNGRNDSAYNGSDNWKFSCNAIHKFAEENTPNDIKCKGCAYNVPIKNKTSDKEEIEIPGDDRLVGNFSKDLGEKLKNKDLFFFKPEEKSVVEIRTFQTKNETNDEEVEYLGFSRLEPSRFVSLVELFVTPIKTTHTKFGKIVSQRSIAQTTAKLVLDSQQFQEHLEPIKRLLTVPIPILHNNKLTFPKKGYDKRFKSWMNYDSPEISNPDMSLEESKKVIEDMYSEFCFKSEQDKVNAIAGLITPFCRGIFSAFNVRGPIFFYIANRERAGKDFCAGVTSIVYEGCVLEEPAISSNDQHSNNSEELRKKITGALMVGRKRLHFSNNKGRIDNAAFEGIATSTRHSDRLLGKNDIIELDNEMDFSLSGNIGVTYTPDFANRCKFINLFLDVEDANSRKFKHPDLHGYIKSNRNLILSALFGLVNNWYKQGMPKGKIPFTSFPEWANICGGIMESAGYDNPCKRDENVDMLSGDDETTNMKRLFELYYERNKENVFQKKDIKDFILSIRKNEDDEFFNDIDFEKMDGQVKFGKRFEKFVGRILSDIRLVVHQQSKYTHLRKYRFSKDEGHLSKDLTKFNENTNKKVKVVKVVKVLQPKTVEKSYTLNEGISPNNLNNLNILKSDDVLDFCTKYLDSTKNSSIPIQDIVVHFSKLGISEKDVDIMLEDMKTKKGLLFESKSGFVSVL